jgi:Flp pilus assembly protein TadG
MTANFWKNTSGNVAIMFGLVSVPLLLAAGAAMDFSHASYVRTVLQGAADAAALVGGTTRDKSDTNLQLVVEQYLAANHAQDVVKHISKIEQHYNSDEGTFTVEVKGELATSFMAIAGITEMDVGARSVVNTGSEALELALVLDNTGSMSGSKIANLKAAANSLVGILEAEASSYAGIKIGVVPFSEYVNIGVGQTGSLWLDETGLGASAWGGCVGSRDAPHDERIGSTVPAYPAVTNVPCNVPLLPLTENLTTVRSTINTMVAKGNTYIPTGLLWGWNVLDNAAPFSEGAKKGSSKNQQTRKAVVLMTDGENTISASYPMHDLFVPANANAKLETLCEAVKDDLIEVYTVSFMVPTQAIKDILVTCATTPSKYFDADNSAELLAAFQQIARDLAAVRLTQ